MAASRPLSVVIIGAGVVGATIAYRLSGRPELQVTVLDRAATGSDAAAHSFAWTNAFSKRPRAYHDLNRRSMDLWHRFVQELGVPGALSPNGNLVLESTPERADALRAQVAELQSWGYACRLVEPDELSAMEPGLVPHGVTTACYLPQEGHVETGAVVRACLDHAAVRGATVVEHAGPVSLALSASGEVHGVRTRG